MPEPADNGRPVERDAGFERQVQNELAVIGAALEGGPAVVLQAHGLLGPDSFYLEIHRIVFDSMVRIAQQGNRPDLTVIANDLEQRGQLALIGGRAALSEIIYASGIPTNVPLYCRTLRTGAGRRRIAHKADEIAAGARNGHTPEDLLALATQAHEEAESVVNDGLVDRAVDYVDFASVIPPLDWIVTDWVSRQDIVIFAGEAGVGKSTTTAALAIALATGKPWCGINIVRPQRVLYFDEEQSLPEAHRLFCRLGAPCENLKVAVAQSVNFSTSEGLKLLLREIKKHRPDVLFFDSLTHAFVGVPENSATDVGQIYARTVLPMRRDYDLTIIATHHLSKPSGDSRAPMSDLQRVRGSTAHSAQCSTIWVADSSDALLEVRQCKRRGAEKRAMRIKYEATEDGAITLTGQPAMAEIIAAAKGKAEKTRERILELVSGSTEPLTIAKLRDLTGLGRATVSDHLSHLVESGKATKVLLGRIQAFISGPSAGKTEMPEKFPTLEEDDWEQIDYEDNDA